MRSRSACATFSDAARGVLALLVGMLGGVAHAGELREIQVTHDDGVYTMHSVTWFDAPLLGVFDVLTDYDQFERVSSVYDEAYYLPLEQDQPPKAFTRIKGCVWFFCQTMERTETMSNLGLHCLRAEADPDVSDFHHSVATWTLRPLDEGTEVTYTVVMEPSFFLPPLIGPYVLKRRLHKGGRDAIDRIEGFANESQADAEVLEVRGYAMVDEADETAMSCADWLASFEQ